MCFGHYGLLKIKILSVHENESTPLAGIPQRFLDGLGEGQTLRQLAMELAAQVGTSTI